MGRRRRERRRRRTWSAITIGALIGAAAVGAAVWCARDGSPLPDDATP
ncbi:hypothetical protein LO763_27390 [Glycomyces sp. A-F 0318]|nr:hypothetical protein [Glycomyces amatae]MCD0447346.1 hypothetical protein [Glycomyces amatae]